MKTLKRIMAAFLVVVLVGLIPGVGTVKVNAATPRTFIIKWVPEMNEWRSQQLPAWDDTRETGNLDYVYFNIADGDSLVIIGGEGTPAFDNLYINQKLANLTLFGVVGNIIAYCNQNVKDIYVLKGTVASIHGSYENVYIYDNSACNVNNNVNYLYIGAESSMTMNVAAVGTVGHCKIENKGTLVKEMFNVNANTLRIVNGEDKTDPANYSTSANTTPAATTTTTTTTATTGGAATTGTGVSPKTGEGSLMIVLFAGAVLCFAGSCYFRKKIA